ncbi:MAG: glycosyltransferase family 4 protein [Saprospiraceae bacterium]|nr:glycosyltransferase family 4 protein [Saprospiraceae bacterium]
MSRKKIAIVANTTWNIFNFRLELVKALAVDNDIVIIAPVDEYIQQLSKISNVHFIPLKRLHRKSINPLWDTVLFIEFINIYKKIQPDLIVHYTIKPNIFGNLAASFCKIPSVCIVTGLGYTFLNEGWVKRITNWLYTQSFRFADKVIFENPDDKEIFVKQRIVSEEKCAYTLGCGLDLDYFMVTQKEAAPNSTFVFLFIGRLLYDKGLVEYVKAARILRQKNINAECWVLGELDSGNPSVIDEKLLIDWIENKDIVYKGYCKDVREIIKEADVVVHPSYRESLARAIQEALAMQKPVIASDITGCREAIDEGKNGFLVPVQQPQKLADAMLKMYQLPRRDLLAMGLNGREKAVREFDVHKINQFLINIFNNIIPIKPPHHSSDAARTARS